MSRRSIHFRRFIKTTSVETEREILKHITPRLLGPRLVKHGRSVKEFKNNGDSVTEAINPEKAARIAARLHSRKG